MTERPSLRADELRPVWELVRRRLERTGTAPLGRLKLPPLTSASRLTLTALIGKAPGATIDLALLEHALCELEIGTSLADALGELGFPVSSEPERRRVERRAAEDARASARGTASAWPDEWAPRWIDDVIRAGVLRGLDAHAAVAIVNKVRRVLDQLDRVSTSQLPTSISRVDLAAELFGDAHALDTGTRLEAATSRALGYRYEADRRQEVWKYASVHLDLTSAPALTWAMPFARECSLSRIVSASTDLGVPLHLSQFALREHPLAVAPGADVLVVENPRIVEAAAQRRSVIAVIATNGNPSSAVRLLLLQLLDQGASIRYHGDYDAAGLAICARMHALGLRPWRMTSIDYLDALNAADEADVTLPIDDAAAPATPWDPTLQRTFDQGRRVVHQERLLDLLLRS
ncbi:MAG TPA: DUF2399 domain-containing protein [Acidimicrobiales bacterium]|nr:DUF2399 domain-containing protein [Acidimicrobiales bacterium]